VAGVHLYHTRNLYGGKRIYLSLHAFEHARPGQHNLHQNAHAATRMGVKSCTMNEQLEALPPAQHIHCSHHFIRQQCHSLRVAAASSQRSIASSLRHLGPRAIARTMWRGKILGGRGADSVKDHGRGPASNCLCVLPGSDQDAVVVAAAGPHDSNSEEKMEC